MQTNVKILLGLGGGLASAGGGYLLLKPSAPKYGAINGMVRLPPDDSQDLTWNEMFKNHFLTKYREFIKEKNINLELHKPTDLEKKEEWGNKLKEIENKVKEEFGKIPQQQWTSEWTKQDDIGRDIRILMQDLCRRSDNNEKTVKYCKLQ